MKQARHDYGQIDHAISAAVADGCHNIGMIINDGMVSMELNKVHGQMLLKWKHEYEKIPPRHYRPPEPERIRVIDRRLQALRKAGVIVYLKGKWQKADQQAEGGNP